MINSDVQKTVAPLNARQKRFFRALLTEIIWRVGKKADILEPFDYQVIFNTQTTYRYEGDMDPFI